MSDKPVGPLKAAQRPKAVRAPAARSEPTDADWQATEDDWVYLRTTKSVRAWKLVALACGIQPARGIAKLLPPELEARYSRLKSTVRGSLAPEAGHGRLLCYPGAINAGASANSKPVQLNDFVVFMDGISEEVHPRMRQIAHDALTANADSANVAPNPSLERFTELARTRIDPKLRPEDISRRVSSIAKLLLAVAIDNKSYGYDVSKLDKEGKTLAGKPSKVFTALSNAVAASGLGAMDSETVREALWFAIDFCGRDKMMGQLLPKKA